MGYHIYNSRTGKFLATKAGKTKNLWSRCIGLLGKKKLDSGEGLIMSHCKGVDTFFMRFPLDLVFIDNDGTVVKTIKNLSPWKISGYHVKASMVLELPIGIIEDSDTIIGDRILIEEFNKCQS